MSVSPIERLRAPRADGAVVARPPLGEADEILAQNRLLFSRMSVSILGRSLADLRRQAVQATLELARAYLSRAGEPLLPGTTESLILAGHQPELFHPGVWVKNFALNGLAQRHQATPVNLIVDSDTAKATALRMPSWRSDGFPHSLLVPFDHWQGAAPYEERVVHDEALFAGFAEQARSHMAGWNFEPMLASFWAEVLRHRPRTPLLGERFVAARRSFERLWGCHNLEVPVSLLCQSEPFAWFACHLLQNLTEFHAIYNDVVRAYRRRQRIRSPLHPVPDLSHDGDWLESPFWGWRRGSQRQRLFVRLDSNIIALRAGKETWPMLEINTAAPVRAWQELVRGGYKVRTRALTTTLFARLFVADLFIHGIGGGIYDELTDEIVRRFYRLEPPSFLVLSATLLLPFARYPAKADDCQRLAQTLRDLAFNPQRYLDDVPGTNGEARQLAEEKNALIRHIVPGELRQRHVRLRDLTERLRHFLADRERQLQEQLDQCRRSAFANQLLSSRDFAFCLYPEGPLREFCRQFLRTGH